MHHFVRRVSKEADVAAPGVEVGRVRLNILPAFCQSVRVEHKLVWGEENAGITQFLVEILLFTRSDLQKEHLMHFAREEL